MFCSFSRKDSDEDSTMSTNWPGRTSWEPKDSLCREKTTAPGESRTNAQYHPQEMVTPVSNSGSGMQGILQSSVEPFYQAI
jgi:hypothetical protein